MLQFIEVSFDSLSAVSFMEITLVCEVTSSSQVSPLQICFSATKRKKQRNGPKEVSWKVRREKKVSQSCHLYSPAAAVTHRRATGVSSKYTSLVQRHVEEKRVTRLCCQWNCLIIKSKSDRVGGGSRG